MNEPHISVSGYPRYRYRTYIDSKPKYRTVILTEVRYINDDTLAYSRITVNGGRWSRDLAVGDTVTFTASLEPNGTLTWIRKVPATGMPHGWQVSDTKRYERRALLLEHQSGKSIAELAAVYGVRRQTISAHLRQAHADLVLSLPRNFHPTTHVTPSQVAELYRQPGISKRQIRRLFQVGSGTVNSLLRQAGIGNLCRRCKAEPAPPGHSFCPPCAAIRRTEHRRQANRSYTKQHRQKQNPATDQGSSERDGRYAQREGIPNAENENPDPSVTPEQSAELYRQPGISVRDASRQLNISRDVLRTLLHHAGVGKLCQDCKRREPTAGRTLCQHCAAARQVPHSAGIAARRRYRARYAGQPGYGSAVLQDVQDVENQTVVHAQVTVSAGRWSQGLEPGFWFSFSARSTQAGNLCYITRTDPGAPYHRKHPGYPIPDRNARKRMLEQLQAGIKIPDIAAAHCIPRRAIDPYLRQACAENGIEPPPNFHRRILDPEPIISLYRQPGMSKAEICRRLHIQGPTLNAVLQQAGIGHLCLRCKEREIPARQITCRPCVRKRLAQYARSRRK